MIRKIIDNIKGDKHIWIIIAILSSISIVLVYSSTRSLAYKETEGNTEYYLLRHGIILIAGLIIMYLVHQIDYRYFSRVAQMMIIISIPLLIYTKFFGVTINEASRWVRIPVIGLTFQSSDFAKLALIMYTSRTLSKKQGVIKDMKEVILHLMLPIFTICSLIMLENFSSAGIVFATCIVILFIGRVSTKFILSIGVGGMIVASLVFAYLWYFVEDHGRADEWVSRIESWIHPNEEADDFYQQKQAYIAIAKGGIFRLAPGKSTQCNFLPDAFSDFIYSTLIEEYGLIGGAIVLFVYLYLLWRIILLVKKSSRAFGALMAVGLGISIVLQSIIHMCVNVHILPNTGITLPLISWGGTSIWFNSIAFGIILSISRSVEEKEINTPTSSKKEKKKVVDEIHG
ncbi:MAG TPA: FtsW/RodA/SpoVE family cell cycle protein [Chitinophagales bacterium]|jgi:cell division protein FtsW|nr:FtsW/RodA/SpoVE family cell cycle protein [Chitinophagales bacterium]HQV77978.1 FtsW/RodA/SpoVE family cell cycle protein [Chitinophagales bacterium]HQW78700.1 FtsW/RodA/SpoVE family cell cycle protein [Chitinophagales bacterium]HRB18502.1 FtsW/RodA/SpoVE family cell cycle protein [Chitinophagales bacterium]HRB68462.1 FtsW/RodA/SpoVE family cell cycle protein [Chitinophagales bacterium]